MSYWRELLTSGESNRTLPTEMLDSFDRQRAFLGFPSYEEQLSRQASGHTPINPLEFLGAITRTIDSVTGAPSRSAVASLQEDINPWKAVGEFQKQFAKNPDEAPTPEQLVNRAGITNPWLKIPLSLAVGMGADPITFAAGAPMARNIVKSLGDMGELGALLPGARKTLAPIDDLGFFSKLEDEILKKMGPSATPREILGISKNVKKSEISAVGLEKFLENKSSVTKDELLSYIRDNRPKISLSFKSDKISDADEARIQKGIEEQVQKIAYSKSMEPGQTKTIGEIVDDLMLDTSEIRSNVMTDLYLHKGSNPARYGAHVEPGGENYREMLVVSPNKDLPDRIAELRRLESRLNTLIGSHANQDNSEQTIQEASQILERISEIKNQDPSFTGGHWGSQNVLGHVRMNDRTIPSVGRSLHAEEIQGDWPQQIRDHGTNLEQLNYKIDQAQKRVDLATKNRFRDEANKDLLAHQVAQKFFKELPKEWSNSSYSIRVKNYIRDGLRSNGNSGFGFSKDHKDALDELINQAKLNSMAGYSFEDPGKLTSDLRRLQSLKDDVLFKNKRLPPETPFKDTWEELLVKNLVNQAAKGGYDAVSITPGYMQSKRWHGNTGLIQAYKKPEGYLKRLFNLMGGKTGTFDIPSGTVPYFQFSNQMKDEISRNGLPLFMAPWALMPQTQEK